MSSTLAGSITVAITTDFLKSFAQIPQKQQSKVREFVEKFRNNPTSSGINYEKIVTARDKNLRSIRIDQDYRGIILKPETGNVYMLLWVDKHDDAYGWAENRLVSIHPDTGSLQIVDVSHEVYEQPRQSADKPMDSLLFAGHMDKDLLRLGIPEVLLPFVRAITSEEMLDKVSTHFPQEAYEALFLLAAGCTLEDVLIEMEIKEQAEKIDTEDFVVALDNSDTRRRFHVVSGALELAEIMNAPLELWRIFLHPSQLKIVQGSYKGSVRVLGGAGTGKTVVAMHRAKYLADRMTGSQRVLFTTFTKNLAADISENLKKLCPTETLRFIEVINLDAWVSKFLRKNGYEFVIAFDEDTRECWSSAMNIADTVLALDEGFYKDEWRNIIQSQGIFTVEEYMKASRVGRGRKISRVDKLKVWSVFEEYRSELRRHNYKEMTDATRDARLLLERQGNVLPYSSVIVDESQDMGMEAFKLLRQIIPNSGESVENDFFIVGDAHQRIYRNRVVLSRCDINVRGRSKKLRINYRTTEEIRRWAVRLLEGKPIDDLDGGEDNSKGYKSLMHGEPPEIVKLDSFAAETDFIKKYLDKLLDDGQSLNSVCLVARTNELLRQYEGALKAKGIPTSFIRRSQADDRNSDGIRMATMHRVKGLEFDHVIIAGCNDGVIPLDAARTSYDPEEVEENEILERALLLVAATRAKKRVLVTCSGEKSSFI